MTSPRLRYTLTLLLSVSLVPIVYSKNFFPCHPSKVTPNNDVNCERVVLPPRLCKTCPLRPTDKEGSFVDCQRIYDTDSTKCHQALDEYVKLNPCDNVRKEAVEGLKAGDEDARSVVDYFLYSICEECCDCVPMGTKRTDYIALASAHKSDDPYLWSETRGNCPAHAQFDVCKVLPNVKYFTKPGGPEVDAPKACPLLREWQNSGAASEWEINPETELRPELQKFLRGLLNAIDCDNFSIWTKCHDMEEKQNHLLIRDQFADLKPDIPSTQKPTTGTTGTTSTTTGTTSTTESTTTGTTAGTTEATTTTGSTTTTETETDSSNDDDDDDDSSNDDDDDSSNDDDDDSSNDDDDDSSDDNNDPETSDDSSTPSDTQSAALGESAPSGSPSTTPSSASGSSSATCFPSSAVVELRSGKMVTMRNLKIGDWVRVSEQEFSQVFLFTHRTEYVDEGFVEIVVGNRTLKATDGHLVYANGVAVPAGTVREGDTMRTMEGIAVVQQVRRVTGKGLYNPHTMLGDLVVDGVVVTTYTTTVERFTATALLTPIRGLFKQGWVGERNIGGWFREGYRSIMPVF